MNPSIQQRTRGWEEVLELNAGLRISQHREMSCGAAVRRVWPVTWSPSSRKTLGSNAATNGRLQIS